MNISYNVLAWKLKEKNYLQDIMVVGRVILKWILKK
jgi:hypothetical protein